MDKENYLDFNELLLNIQNYLQMYAYSKQETMPKKLFLAMSIINFFRIFRVFSNADKVVETFHQCKDSIMVVNGTFSSTEVLLVNTCYKLNLHPMIHVFFSTLEAAAEFAMQTGETRQAPYIDAHRQSSPDLLIASLYGRHVVSLNVKKYLHLLKEKSSIFPQHCWEYILENCPYDISKFRKPKKSVVNMSFYQSQQRSRFVKITQANDGLTVHVQRVDDKDARSWKISEERIQDTIKQCGMDRIEVIRLLENKLNDIVAATMPQLRCPFAAHTSATEESKIIQLSCGEWLSELDQYIVGDQISHQMTKQINN